MPRLGGRSRTAVTAVLAVMLSGLALAPAGATERVECGPVDAVAPKYIAPPSIRDGAFDFADPDAGGNAPPEDRFLFSFSGGRVDQPHREFFGYRSIDALGGDSYLQGHQGFHFRVADPAFTGINLWFSVVPRSEKIDSMGGTDDGLFLRRIEVPLAGARPGDDALEFSPVSAETSGGLRIAHFPFWPGRTYDDRSVEVATKDNRVGPLWLQSGNVITSSVTIGGREIFPVCDQLAQAWKVSLLLRSTGEYRWTLAGTFWLGTHIGGWPIKDDFVFVSEDRKLISGSFASNLARLEPGEPT